MAIAYEPADNKILGLRDHVIEKYFPEMIVAGLVIDVIMATHPDGKAAVKVGGNPCFAKIKRIGAEDRCKLGAPDVRITIDATKYASAKPKRRAAVFHHELRHVVLTPDMDGPKDDSGHWLRYVTDDTGRAKVGLCADDVAITGFLETYQLFGEDSVEHANFAAIESIFGQEIFGFMRDGDGGADASPAHGEPTDATRSTVTLSSGGRSVTLDGSVRTGDFDANEDGDYSQDGEDGDDDEPESEDDLDDDERDGDEYEGGQDDASDRQAIPVVSGRGRRKRTG